MKKTSFETALASNDLLALSRCAAISAIKKAYSASGSEIMRQMLYSLISDIRHLDVIHANDNYQGKTPTYLNKYVRHVNSIGHDATPNTIISSTLSDASDCINVAYAILFEYQIKGYSAADTITRTYKSGKTRDYTIYQLSIKAVRAYIYAQKHIESDSKYTYIDDYADADDSNSISAIDNIDRQLLRINGMVDVSDYSTLDDMSHIMTALDLTARQTDILNYRLKGLSVNQIAEKLDVSHQAITKTLIAIQSKISDIMPDAVRLFKSKR